MPKDAASRIRENSDSWQQSVAQDRMGTSVRQLSITLPSQPDTCCTSLGPESIQRMGTMRFDQLGIEAAACWCHHGDEAHNAASGVEQQLPQS